MTAGRQMAQLSCNGRKYTQKAACIVDGFYYYFRTEKRLPNLHEFCDSATRFALVMSTGTQCIISNVQILTDLYGAFEKQRELKLVKDAVAVEPDDELVL